MGVFAALTLALAGQAALALAVMGSPRGVMPRVVMLFPVFALLPLAAHLVLEGARWQMAPAYLAATGLAAAGIFAFARPAPRGVAGRAQGPGARLAGLSGVVLLAAAAALSLSR
jgi:hypothetical protein